MEPAPVAATALALLAGGWLLAGWRRQSPKPTLLESVRCAVADDRTVVFASVSAMAAVVLGSASSAVIAGALVAATAGLLLSRGILAGVVAAGAAAWAPVVVAPSHPGLVLPLGLGAATALVVAGAARHRGAPAIVCTAAASAITMGAAAFAIDELGLTAALLVAVFAGWAAALVVDRTSNVAALVARSTLLVAALTALSGTSADALPVMVAATLLLLVDAVRTDDPRIAYGAVLTGPLAVFTAAALGGLTEAESGVVLAGAAVVLTGLAALTPDRWRLPVLTVAAASIGAALPLSLAEPVRFAETIVLAGGLVIALGLTLRQSFVAHAGGALATIGIAAHLSVDGVTATEPFVLPVALQLLVLGVQLRRRAEDAPSSWIAFGPSIALLGVAALAERLDGGPAWHALVAGGVGVVAVAAGGWKRLAAPLFLGTALVVGVTVLETLHTLAGVPTWAWLAAGGSALLLAGIALERSATSPSEAGRRLVDVVGERFE